MKFRPAMTFGHVIKDQEDQFKFKNGYYEIDPDAATPPGEATPERHNPGWYWGGLPSLGFTDQSSEESYFFPGGDALVTNLIESSSVSVEFFYGQNLSSILEHATEFNPAWDPGD